jgi:Kef-type K+ transport system membrane component KefB
MLKSPMDQGPTTLLLELFAIFLAAKAVGEVFERLHLPAVLGEILAGITLGPYALNWIPTTPAIHSIAEVGAIFLLFTAGLETSPGELVRVGRTAVLVAISGVVLPFVLGYGFMRLRGDASTEAIFVGAAMVATSVGITARVLADLNVLSSDLARIILGAAVFDDILGMILLATVAGVASGRIEWLRLGILAAESVAFAVFMILVAPRLVRRMHSGVERLSTHNAPLVITLLICLLLSWLAASIGMAAIVGAFFAGLMFSDYAPRWNLLPRAQAITEFLAPYFFFSIGARLDPDLFTHRLLRTAVLVSTLAIVSKIVGCGAPLIRKGWHSALTVGVGMTPRGEVALIVALVGLNSHIVSQATYGVVVFMTGITTLLAPPVLRYLLREERMQERERAVPDAVLSR